MRTHRHLRRAPRTLRWLGVSALALVVPTAFTQTPNAGAPVSIPAGVSSDTKAAAPEKPIPPRNAREADDLYIDGARQIERHDYDGAEKNFAHAVQLNPKNPDYLRAFAFAREGRVVTLLHAATAARVAGDIARANDLLAQAHKLDPDNNIVNEHLANGGELQSPAIDPLRVPADSISPSLAGPVELSPTPGTREIHERGDEQTVLRNVYSAFGIKVQFDSTVNSSRQIRFDLDDATFDSATHLLSQITKTFYVAVQPKLALIAQNSQDNRDRLEPQLEETIYLRGMTSDQMQDLANLARNVYDVKNVTASATGGTILIRSDEQTLKLVNAEYADMLDGSSDVMLDVTLYEVDESRTRDFGVTTPTSLSAFPLATELENVLNQNQAVLTAAENAGLLTLNGTPLANLEKEFLFLAAGGYVGASQLSLIEGILGTVGSYGGLPFLGVSIASGATVTAMLSSSDARVVDAVQIRASDSRGATAQKTTFRTGTRYPIETASYTSGGASNSAISSALAGQSAAVQAAAAQYLGSATQVTIPQIQYEDLGLTFTATPKIQKNSDINLALELKIENLGSGSLNGIPELNSRDFTSTVTVPNGQTALLVSTVNSSEMNAIAGLPGLSELPGFQGGTEKNSDKSSTELIISITPHIVRDPAFRIASRPVEYERPPANQ